MTEPAPVTREDIAVWMDKIKNEPPRRCGTEEYPHILGLHWRRETVAKHVLCHRCGSIPIALLATETAYTGAGRVKI